MSALLVIGAMALVGGSMFVFGVRTGRRWQREDDAYWEETLQRTRQLACRGPDGNSPHGVHVACAACLPRDVIFAKATRP